MTKNKKIILAVLIAILLGAGGYFLIFKLKKLIPSDNVGEKAQEDKFAKWQTYYGWTKGFEIKIPPEWSKNYDHDGPYSKLENKFWRDQVGEAEFISSATATSTSKFRVTVKDSDLSIEEFGIQVNVHQGEKIVVNNLPAIKLVQDSRSLGENNYKEIILIKKENRYYYLQFSASDKNTDQDIAVWNMILGTFQPK